jgi:ABC-type phosphate transport system substrate-binding protein
MHLAHRPPRAGVVAAALVASLAAQRAAHAADCSTLPNPIYGQGGNSPKPLVAKLGAALTAANPPQTIVYQSPGQCTGLDTLIADGGITGTASYWTADGVETTCTLSLTGDPITFALMNSYATLCPEITALPGDIGDFLGPTQSFDFVVPKASSQTNISAAAAYFVLGFGAQGQAAPWTDENLIYRRGATSGVSLFLGLAVGVPIDKMKGIDAGSNSAMVSLLSASTNPNATIGMVSDEFAQANADVINVLAYQHYGQDCGYWPSSTPTSLDKRNIRDGHYYVWSPVHFFARTDGSGKPAHGATRKLIGYITGDETPPASVDVLRLSIEAGTIPDCAMEVQRDSDLGPISSYAPDEPCGCFFDQVATGATTCTACPNGDECPANAPNCRFGYCEVN